MIALAEFMDLLEKYGLFLIEIFGGITGNWFTFDESREPRCLAEVTQGSSLLSSLTFSAVISFLENSIHLVLLFTGSGSVLKSMECSEEKSSQIFSIN